MENSEITLRPVTEADNDLLLRLYAGTRAEEVARVPWTQEQKDAFIKMQFAAQNQHYRAEYPHATHEIICRKGEPVGRLYLSRTREALHILDITVLPEKRSAGTGSVVLRRLMEEARGAGKPLTIYVETFNRSQNLFRRLGFQPGDAEGFHSLFRFG